MAITYPLSTAVFADQLGIREIVWGEAKNQGFVVLGGGESFAIDKAPTLQRGKALLKDTKNIDVPKILALLSLPEGSLNEFYLYDPRNMYAKNDTASTAFNAYTPTLLTINANKKAVSFTGMPPNFSLLVGDTFHITYSSTRISYHRLVENINCNGSGITGEAEVRPHIPLSVTAGASVTFKKPCIKAVMVPESIDYGNGGLVHTTGMSFEFVMRL